MGVKIYDTDESGNQRYLETPQVKSIVRGSRYGSFDEPDFKPNRLTVSPMEEADSTMVHELLHYYSRLGRDASYCGLNTPDDTQRWLNEAVTSRLETRVMRQAVDVDHTPNYTDHRRVYNAVRTIGDIEEDLFTAAYFEQPTLNETTGRVEQPARRALNLAIRNAFGPGFMSKLSKVYAGNSGEIDTAKALEFVEEARFRILADYPEGVIESEDIHEWLKLYKPDYSSPRWSRHLFRLRTVSLYESPWKKRARKKQERLEEASRGDRADAILAKYRQMDLPEAASE